MADENTETVTVSDQEMDWRADVALRQTIDAILGNPSLPLEEVVEKVTSAITNHWGLFAKEELNEKKEAMRNEEVRENQLPEGWSQRSNQVMAPTEPRIDRERGLILGVHVAGLVCKDDGMEYDIEGHKKDVVRLNGMPVGLDHDFKGGPALVERTWGKLQDAWYDENGQWANLAFNQKHPCIEQILYDVEHLHTMGLSTVVKYNQKNLVKNRLHEWETVGVDLVVGPRTTGYLLNQADPTKVTPPVSSVVDSEVRFNQLQQELVELKNTVVRQNQLLQEMDLRLRLKVEPQKALVEKIAETESKFDLSNFYWGPKKC